MFVKDCLMPHLVAHTAATVLYRNNSWGSAFLGCDAVLLDSLALDNEGTLLLQNVRNHAVHMASHPTSHQPSATLL
jgi:hypothetical protein